MNIAPGMTAIAISASRQLSAISTPIAMMSRMMEIDGETMAIDARPSDAIALALRTRAPIFVEEQVIDNAKTVDFTPDKPDADRLHKWLNRIVEVVNGEPVLSGIDEHVAKVGEAFFAVLGKASSEPLKHVQAAPGLAENWYGVAETIGPPRLIRIVASVAKLPLSLIKFH